MSKNLFKLILLIFALISCKVEEVLLPPTVDTNLASEITISSAKISGVVVSEGSSGTTERGFLVSSLNQNPTTSDMKLVSGLGKGEFNSSLTNLEDGKFYYYKAYAINKAGVAYGLVKSFNTTAIQLPTINATLVTSVNDFLNLGGTINAEITNDGGSPILEAGIVYGKIPNPTILDSKIKASSFSKFTIQLSGLEESTTYGIRAYATNSKGTKYSDPITLTTIQSFKTRLKSGLVTYINFDNDVKDQSGNGINGEIYAATFTQNRFNEGNKAVNFSTAGATSGSRNQEVFIPYNPKFNSDQLSVSIWVNPNTYGWTGNQSTFSTIANRFQFGYSNPNGQTWHLVNTSTGIQANIHQASSTNNQVASSLISKSPLTLGVWTHLVMTFDGTTHKLYINGVLAESRLAGIKLNTSGTSGISIGESNQANGYWFPFNGKIDDFGLWNRALTDSEIYYLFTQGNIF